MSRVPPLKFLACLFLVAPILCSSASVFAQGQEGSRVSGDWELYNESRNSRAPSNMPNTAGTISSNQEARLEFTCTMYQVEFDLRPGRTFQAGLDPSSTVDDIVFTKVGKVDYFRRTLLKRWEAAFSFDTDVGELMRGSTLLICPKEDDKNPACLTFSLRGFNAALKALCPKR